jgi:N-6 DNA Methylase
MGEWGRSYSPIILMRQGAVVLDSIAVTKRFYARFKVERAAFLTAVQGIPTGTERVGYASLMLNRLMFVYFLQHSGLLDGDTDYLSHCLSMMQASEGKDAFYHHFLLRFFHEGLGSKQPQMVLCTTLLGNIPCLGLSLFKEHILECSPTTIFIADEAFVQLFAFFDSYQWQLDGGLPGSEQELCPDILGFICEQSIHQKEMGAYYTRADVTEYIARNTIIPCLFMKVEANYPLTFGPNGNIWQLLQINPDRYIYTDIRRTDYLPTETEREYQARRFRYEQLRSALVAGDLHSMHDLVTYNLNIGQFAVDVLEHCKEPEELRAFFECLTQITILDPTCGTGAFLLAALKVLEPLYRICIERLQESGGRPAILASIIANNLYGVDIMREATEVCEMRLVLGLLAHIDREEDGRMVSDLRCNIRVGDALVEDMHFGTKHSGFDVIIGNPPYIECSKVRHNYTIPGYETWKRGNLYAMVLERSLALCRPELSYLGLIVPLSICGSERFGQLRTMLSTTTTSLWLANFEIFPSRLFEGAFQRLSILIAKHGSDTASTVYVTRTQRWYTTERPHLLPLITYTATQCTIKPGVFPKLASSLQETILRKVVERADGVNIATVLCPHRTAGQHKGCPYFVYYQEATNYWMKATCRVPFFKKNGIRMVPTHGRLLFFRDELTAHTVMALMNSSLFYLWFATYSDGFHLSHALVKEFPVARELYAVKELLLLATRLEEEIKQCARMSTRNTKKDRIEIEEYRMGQSKALLDEIDAVLAHYYHFTSDELELIIHYDQKYRMGRGDGTLHS